MPELRVPRAQGVGRAKSAPLARPRVLRIVIWRAHARIELTVGAVPGGPGARSDYYTRLATLSRPVRCGSAKCPKYESGVPGPTDTEVSVRSVRQTRGPALSHGRLIRRRLVHPDFAFTRIGQPLVQSARQVQACPRRADSVPSRESRSLALRTAPGATRPPIVVGGQVGGTAPGAGSLLTHDLPRAAYPPTQTSQAFALMD